MPQWIWHCGTNHILLVDDPHDGAAQKQLFEAWSSEFSLERRRKGVDEKQAARTSVRLVYGSYEKADVDSVVASLSSQGPDRYQVRANEQVYNLPILKSNLQKAVRRQNKSAALATAAQMWVQAPLDLIRRLSVIAVEDVTLHYWTAHVTWLMAAMSKGFVPSTFHRLVVLKLVELLVECPHPPKIFKYGETPTVPADMWLRALKPRFAELPMWMASTLFGLIVRVAFGGMPGDMLMLRGTFRVTLANTARLISKMPAVVDAPTLAVVQPAEPPLFAHCHQLSEAIDFHCTPILPILQRWLPLEQQKSHDELKRVMWECRSSYNTRRAANVSATTPPEWWLQYILPHLDAECQQMWKTAKARPTKNQASFK